MMDKEDEKINNCSPVARHVNEREACTYRVSSHSSVGGLFGGCA